MNRIPTSFYSPTHGQLIMWDQIIYLGYTTINLISHFFVSYEISSKPSGDERWFAPSKHVR